MGRYTHRVAISNSRLLACEHGRVTFRYKDYADNQRLKQMTLDADEFIRRFLLHVLPKGFVRIRHYGLLAGRNVDTKLAACRQLLATAAENPEADPLADAKPTVSAADIVLAECLQCPHCHAPLRRRELLPAYLLLPLATAIPLAAGLDSS